METPVQQSTCYHCGADNNGAPVFHDEKAFCCNGCVSVYQLLTESGLDSFYTMEDKPGVRKYSSDSGKFDWAKDPKKYPMLNEPDPSYHGLVYAQALGVGSPFGANLAYIFKIRLTLLRDIGAAVSPFNAWLLAQGLETLSLRIERHVENAKAVAAFLEKHPQVSSVNYASLTSSKWNKLATKYSPKGSGSVLSFEIKGGIESGKKFIEALNLHSHVANIGDVRSLAIHPASTTHSQLSPAEQLSAGVTPGLVRLSVGIENIKDIQADLEKAFTAAK